MSSITFSTTAIPARPVTRLRLTARGCRVLLGLAALSLAAGISFAALSGGSAVATGQSANVSFGTVMVMPGDTLWSIVEAIAPAADPREIIGEISRLNMIDGGPLQVGQKLAIPAQYAN